MLFGKIKALVEYGVRTGLIEAEDTIYTRNRLLEALCEEDYADEEAEQSENLALLLDGLCDEAVKRGIIEDGATSRDLFDTKLMGLLTPRPSDVNRTFRALYKESPEKATDWFYKLCGDCNYIRRDRVARDLKWVYNDPRFGAIDITINLSKPEKDPKKRFVYLYSRIEPHKDGSGTSIHETTREQILKNIAAYLIGKEYHPKNQRFILLDRGRLMGWYGKDDYGYADEAWYRPRVIWEEKQIMEAHSGDRGWNFIKLSINQEFLEHFEFQLISEEQIADIDKSGYWILEDIGHGTKSLKCLE